MPVSCLIAFLLVVAPAAWAGWEEIASRDGQALFIDQETIRRDGSLRRVWTLCSYAAPNADGALSTKSLIEYDCADRRYRILTISAHEECMGEGRTLHVEAALDPWWRDIVPGTVAAKVHRQVCAQ
jgi:hypothetical protein